MTDSLDHSLLCTAETLKDSSARRRQRELVLWENAALGSLAGAIAAACTTPLDVVKTRLMTDTGSEPRYSGVIHALRTIAREEGPRALLAGIGPRVAWIGFGGAIFIGSFEEFRRRLA